MPVITPSTPSSSVTTSSPSASAAGASGQADFARLMGQANERKGPADDTRPSLSQRQTPLGGQKPAAPHKSRAAERTVPSDSTQAAQPVAGTKNEPVAASSKPTAGAARGNKLPQEQDKAPSLKAGEADATLAPDWPALGASGEPTESDVQLPADDATQALAPAGDWQGDGEAWLAHLLASREQAAELGTDPAPSQAQDRQPAAAVSVELAVAPQPLTPIEGHDMADDAATEEAALRQGGAAGEISVPPTAQSAEAAAGLAAEFATQTAPHSDEPAASQAQGPHAAAQPPSHAQDLAAQGTSSTGLAQSAALTGAYLNGLATGDLATNAGQPTRGAGLGKEVKAATQQAGQLAGALVGQSSAAQAAEAQTKGAEVQHALASDGSERTLEQLATSHGLAGLTSQSGAAAGAGGESQSALGHTAATHGHSAQGASLGQTPPLADKSDRLPSALPTLSSFAMTANQADNAEQLGQRLTLMLGQKWHEAELQLEPEGLGKMRIQLKMDQEQQAQVHILVQHQQTKELVDQALPRLRDMLAGQGIQMSQAQVQQHSAGQQGMGAQGGQWGGQGQGSGQGAAAQDDASQSLEETVPQTLAIHSTGSAGIDFYA